MDRSARTGSLLHRMWLPRLSRLRGCTTTSTSVTQLSPSTIIDLGPERLHFAQGLRCTAVERLIPQPLDLLRCSIPRRTRPSAELIPCRAPSTAVLASTVVLALLAPGRTMRRLTLLAALSSCAAAGLIGLPAGAAGARPAPHAVTASTSAANSSAGARLSTARPASPSSTRLTSALNSPSAAHSSATRSSAARSSAARSSVAKSSAARSSAAKSSAAKSSAAQSSAVKSSAGKSSAGKSSAGKASASPSSTKSSASPSSATPGPSSGKTRAGSHAPKAVAVAGPPCTGPNAAASGPVVCLPAGFGEDQAAPLSIGGSVVFGAQVVNNGPAVPDATVVITLPSTLRLDPDFPPTRFEQWWTDNADDTGTPLACVGPVDGRDGRTVTCGTGPLVAGANIIIGVGFTTSATATVTSPPATFTVALNPALPTTPTPNRVQATVYFVGSAKLILTVNPDHARVTVGNVVTLTGTVRNDGPNAAPNSYLFGADFADDGGNAHFQIINSAPLPGAPSGSANGSARTLAIAADPNDVKQPSFGYWPLDTIGPGESASTAIILKASTVGTDELGVSADSDAIDQDCDLDGSGSVSGSSSASAGSAVPAHKSVVKLVPRRVRGHRVTAQQAGVCEDFVLVELTAVAAASTSATATTTRPPSTIAPTSTSPHPTATDPATTSPAATAVAVAASSTTVAPASSSTLAAAGDTELADTGARQTRPMVIASLLAVLAGVALCLAGRRRPARVHSSHR